MKSVKIAIIVAALAGAVIITLVFGFRDDHPETEDTMVNFRCTACDHHFTMTNKEFYEHLKKEPIPWPPAVCPNCGKKAAYRIQQCPQCGTWFFGPEVQGSLGVCPKCFPEHEPPEEKYIEEDVGGERRRIPIRAI